MRGAKPIVLVLALTLAVSFSHPAHGAIPWAANWQEASARAQRYRQLVLIHFTRDDCPPCAKLKQTVLTQPAVRRAIASNYVPLKVGTNENASLKKHYGVRQVPTDLVVTPQGEEIWRSTSPQDPNDYVAMLDKVAAHQHIGRPLKKEFTSQFARNSPPQRSSAFPVQGSRAKSTQSRRFAPSGTSADARTRAQNRFARSASPAASSSSDQHGSPPGNSGPLASPAGSQSSQENPPSAANPVRSSADASRATANPFADHARNVPGSTPARSVSKRGHAQGRQPGGASSSGFPQREVSAGTINQFAADDSRAPSPHDSPRTDADASASGSVETATPAKPSGEAAGLALDGYCCVTLVEEEKWVKGDPRWGVNHRGRTYLFAGRPQQQQFLGDYSTYTPALSGYDCVKYAESGALVEGKRAHGVFYRDQIFLFANEAALKKFWENPNRYVSVVQNRPDRQAARPRN